ncbi:MAG: 30S ribosomal protein S20 [Candidatus Aminicenantes bacterium]|nr:MAG: 30S ribosomal protein S20 [Candidatus Aminicenantes bacterium]
MASHKSALKKYFRDEKRRMINKMNRSKMKNRIKLFIKKLDAGQLEEAKALFPRMISRIDKTIRKGTIHRGTGARLKSRVMLRARKAGLEV